MVVLRETKEIKDKILGSYYSWVFTVTHGCSPMSSGLPEVLEIPEILEIRWKRKNFGFCVICMGALSTNYSPFTPG